MNPLRLMTQLLLCLAVFQLSGGFLAAAPSTEAAVGEYGDPVVESEVDYNWIFIKVGILAIVLLAVYMAVFFIIFRMMIRGGRAWPQDAYCRSWMMMWLASAVVIIYMFEPDLAIPPATEDWQRLGIEGGIVCLALGLAAYLYFTVKTPKSVKDLLGEVKAPAKA